MENKRDRIITFNGKTQNMSQWSKELGMTDESLSYRLKHWSLEDAMTRPVDPKHYKLGKAAKLAQGKKPYKSVWKDLYDSIDETKMYYRTFVQELTSGGSGTRAFKNGEIPLHTFEGGVIKVKGFDIKQWILKAGYTIVERPTTSPEALPAQAVAVPAPKRAYHRHPAFRELQVTPPPQACVFKEKALPFSIVGLAGVLLGLIIGFVRI